ncbi:MAG TPA: IS3 family transposase [Polyangia bacterium]|nr:IS3 family transposase [Polyangia bacterium]
MPRTRPPYPPEFRQEAVRLLRSGARSTKQLADELGCSPQTLSNWVRQDQADRGERQDVLSSEERQRLRELERENKVLRQEREILKRAGGFLCQGDRSTVTRFRFVEAEAAQFPVSLLCRVIGVTRQGYYAWKRRPPSARELADRKLCERIRQIYAETEEIYGAPRIHSELKLGDGIAVGKKRVARLMRQLGIRGADGRRGRVRTTVRDPKRDSAPDLVDRDFARAEPNRLWVCDLKYIQTGQGFLFLAAVQDVFSRRIVGWSMRDDLKSELVLDALGMAVTTRGGDAAGVVAHSDHGSQYTSLVYGAYAKQSGIDLSMGSIGDPWDNALAESFFASLEKELLRRERFQTREHARLRIFWYIECFYNPRRRHSSLGMLSPVDYEQRHQQEAIAA